MIQPLTSVAIETINARTATPELSLPDALAPTMESLHQQSVPREMIELVIVLDANVSNTDADEIARRWPTARLVSSLTSNYFAAKNVGAAAASSEIVAYLDSDCVPGSDWLELLTSRFDSTVAAVGGRSHYAGSSFTARTFSVPDFNFVLTRRDGLASGFNLNNVAFRRDVLVTHPFETRIRRDGGCYLLFHQLQAEGARILHEPRALTYHRQDFHGLGFIGKHFNRGYDSVAVYRLDDRAVLRGTMWLRRLGGVALFGITGLRILRDWRRMARHRRQIGISPLALPYFYAVVTTTRMIEMLGGLTAVVFGK